MPAIVKATYLGQAEQEYGLVPPGLLGYWADAPKYKRDVAKAKEFMAKAGVTSLDLRIDIQDTSEYRSWAEIAQQNLKEIGINLTINPMDSSSFWEHREGDKGKDVELSATTTRMQPDPSWATMWFTCDQVGVWNWQRWCNKEYDDLHKQGPCHHGRQGARARSTSKCSRSGTRTSTPSGSPTARWTTATLPTIKPATTPHGLMQPWLLQAGVSCAGTSIWHGPRLTSEATASRQIRDRRSQAPDAHLSAQALADDHPWSCCS